MVLHEKRFKISADELRDRLERYFSALGEDPERRGGPSDLLAALDLDMETARWLTCDAGPPYREHAKILREAATRLRGHLETAKSWSGSNASKSAFLVRQTLWDGLAYQERKEGPVKAPEIQIRFGCGADAFD